jgi:hypothetical protein
VGTELRVCPPSPCKMATCPFFVLCHTSTSIREGLQVGAVEPLGLRLFATYTATQREALQARDARAVQSTARFMLRFVSCDSQLVIFDCDGVLVDSEVISNRVLAEMLSTEGLPTTLAQARHDYQGLLLADVLSRAQEKLGRTLPQDWLDRYETERAAAFHRELEPWREQPRR